MYSKEQFSSLLSRPSRQQTRRPQTPLAASNYHPPPSNNKSYSKMQGVYSGHGSNYQNIQAKPPGMSKSRISVNSSASQLSFLNSDQGEIFPEDLIFLLKNEQKNINNFKEKIQKEKNRVENDFAVLKVQIDHILEDLKLSVQAQLDQVYKVFISKYAEVKGQVQQIRRLRKQILMANSTGPLQSTHHKDTSNYDILSEIEKDAEHFRNFRVYGYLTQMQKNKINPILEICNEIILIGSADCPFYKSKEMSLKNKEIKSAFSTVLAEVYQQLDKYIVTPEWIVQRQKEDEQNANLVLKNLEGDHFRQSPPKEYDPMKKKNFQPSEVPQNWQNQTSKIPLKSVSRSEQTAIAKWGQTINLKKLQRVVTDHQDAILCVYFIDGQYIATGSKDKTINVYSLEGQKVITLRGHEASICSLSTIRGKLGNTYLASGSDHGCSCLILWDIRTWAICSRIQAHVAAVTCILDMEDGEHLLTGSYDKKINLFNHRRGEVISSYNNKSGLTSLVLTSDHRHVVSSGLEHSIIVWNIISTANGLNLEQVRAITNNSMVCKMEACLLRPEIIVLATRDGRIKTLNIEKDCQFQKVYTANENSIIELVCIEREMTTDSPLVLSCSSKDKSLCLTRMQSGQSQLMRINTAFNIQFGCGIGPKIVLSPHKGGLMAILSQSGSFREFSIFEISLK